MHSFKIDNRNIGLGAPVYLIAEAGVNHNGQIELARKLVDAAVEAQVDAVKFQSFVVEELVLKSVRKAPYQETTTGAGQSQFYMLKTFEIDRAFHYEIIDYCKKKGVTFMSTPYDETSLDLLLEIDAPALKIASTDTTNLFFLEKIARSGKPVILSTGMSGLFEIEQSYRCLRENGCQELALLKCTTNYPTIPEEVNLNAMQTMRHVFADAVIGFSDHTEGVGASPFAVAAGAKIIEKHFTLDKEMSGPDHRASLSPNELKLWVQQIRYAEKLLGRPEITPTKSERHTRKAMQKCLVARREIKAGDLLSRENLAAKRTDGVGVPVSFAYWALGKKATQPIEVDGIVHWSTLAEPND